MGSCCDAQGRCAQGRWYLAASVLMLALLVAGVTSANGQQHTSAVPSRPGTMVTIQGQASLASGRPAVRAVVKLITRGGVPREAFTDDHGRFEFPLVEEGGYVLTATSLVDPSVYADPVETDTSRTATGRLNVNLTLHGPLESRSSKPGVIHVGESAAKIPKEARKAFERGQRIKGSEPAKALESFSRAIELWPQYFQALTERGDLFISQRKLAEARVDFDRALKVESKYGPALRGAGYCRLEGRQFEEAVSHFERSILVAPDNANSYLLLGIANLELDRRQQAKQALEKSLTFTSQRVSRAHIYLANLYALEHRYQQAADELRKYLDAEPTAPDAKAVREMEARWRTRTAAP
jgi:Tfp pilus assembly protein PilF